jgi:hypothetical protein
MTMITNSSSVPQGAAVDARLQAMLSTCRKQGGDVLPRCATSSPVGQSPSSQAGTQLRTAMKNLFIRCHRDRFFEVPYVPSFVLGFLKTKNPLLPPWEKGVRGNEGHGQKHKGM